MNVRSGGLLATGIVLLASMTAGPVALAGEHGDATAVEASKKLRYLRFFPVGQCTRWAYRKRPDIVNVGTDRFRISDWNAYRWSANARRSGFPVSGQARAGDIAVWGRGQAGAGRFGHVAYVEAVGATGDLRISEVNFNGSTTTTRRTLPASEANALEYVHRR
jgi:surface antigen